MHNLAATIVGMDVNNPASTVACDRAAIAARPTGSMKLVSDEFPVFQAMWLRPSAVPLYPVEVIRFSLTMIAPTLRPETVRLSTYLGRHRHRPAAAGLTLECLKTARP
jgi:hypothetical protein